MTAKKTLNSRLRSRVISASRRTDMVASNPDNLVQQLVEKAPPESTHTLVLWTKDPHNILYHAALNTQLKKYDQLFLHLSITGLGATLLEPRVPQPEVVLSTAPALIEFIAAPERMTVRFDPIVHFRTPDGGYISNVNYFEKLAPALSKTGVTRVTTSWVQIYGKVAKRLEKMGITVVEQTGSEQQREAEWLLKKAREYGLHLQGCCISNWPPSSCIDGALLNKLHPLGKKASTKRAAGQRALCGCTESYDIGWYHACVHGCVYCYGSPQIYNTLKR